MKEYSKEIDYFEHAKNICQTLFGDENPLSKALQANIDALKENGFKFDVL